MSRDGQERAAAVQEERGSSKMPLTMGLGSLGALAIGSNLLEKQEAAFKKPSLMSVEKKGGDQRRGFSCTTGVASVRGWATSVRVRPVEWGPKVKRTRGGRDRGCLGSDGSGTRGLEDSSACGIAPSGSWISSAAFARREAARG